MCYEIENMNITWILNPYKISLFFQNKKIDISIALQQRLSFLNGDFTLWRSHYSTMKYAKHLRKMNFLNSPSVFKKKKKRWGVGVVYKIFSSLFSALGICPDLQRVVSSSADLWQWHMSCVGEDWGGSRGDKREWSWSVAQPESEYALVSKDGHVWPKTQTAPHPLISAQKHLWVADGEASTHTFRNVEEHWEASKLPLNSWAAGRDGYTGENKRRSGGEGGERSISRDSPLVKADLAEAKPRLFFSFPLRFVGTPPPLTAVLVLSHSVGRHKLQRSKCAP